MKLLEQYFEIQNEIYKYFEYEEDWVVIPLDSRLDCYWMVVGGDEKGAGGYVTWSPEPFTKESLEDGGKTYGGPIYTQRFLPKWIYRKEDYTMISIDTRCDGNKFLMIFDNSKECTDEIMKQMNPWAFTSLV